MKTLKVTEFEVPEYLIANKEGSIIKIQREMQRQHGTDIYLRFEFKPKMRLIGIKVEGRED